MQGGGAGLTVTWEEGAEGVVDLVQRAAAPAAASVRRTAADVAEARPANRRRSKQRRRAAPGCVTASVRTASTSRLRRVGQPPTPNVRRAVLAEDALTLETDLVREDLSKMLPL